jgi:hypothetical protein
MKLLRYPLADNRWNMAAGTNRRAAALWQVVKVLLANKADLTKKDDQGYVRRARARSDTRTHARLRALSIALRSALKRASNDWVDHWARRADTAALRCGRRAHRRGALSRARGTWCRGTARCNTAQRIVARCNTAQQNALQRSYGYTANRHGAVCLPVRACADVRVRLKCACAADLPATCCWR